MKRGTVKRTSIIVLLCIVIFYALLLVFFNFVYVPYKSVNEKVKKTDTAYILKTIPLEEVPGISKEKEIQRAIPEIAKEPENMKKAIKADGDNTNVHKKNTDTSKKDKIYEFNVKPHRGARSWVGNPVGKYKIDIGQDKNGLGVTELSAKYTDQQTGVSEHGGTVIFFVKVNNQGAVSACYLRKSTNPQLNAAAEKTIRKYNFRESGSKIREGTITVKFTVSK